MKDFNPRTHVGCDAIFGKGWLISEKFQSTHPRGVRRALHPAVRRVQGISIHAPTWGATSPPRTPQPAYHNFNPRTHVGCDVLYIQPSDAFKEFQSTHPRGVRHRLPELPNRHTIISIHAPTWGATSSHYIKPQVSRISIHAPTWGATGVLCGTGLSVKISIHAPTWGATGARG